MQDLWSRCAAPVPAADPIPVELPDLESGDAQLAWLSSAVTVRAIEARSVDLWMVHAAGLADPGTGATVALIGPSGAGKTTASRILAQTFGYVSDETVGIDPSGAVLPYPKPLSVVQPNQAHKRQVSPDDLDLVQAPRDCRLAGVVLLNRTAGATVSQRPLPTGEALVRLAEQTSFVARMDQPLRTMARHLESVGGAVEITYAEADDLIPVVRSIMDA